MEKLSLKFEVNPTGLSNSNLSTSLLPLHQGRSLRLSSTFFISMYIGARSIPELTEGPIDSDSLAAPFDPATGAVATPQLASGGDPSSPFVTV